MRGYELVATAIALDHGTSTHLLAFFERGEAIGMYHEYLIGRTGGTGDPMLACGHGVPGPGDEGA